MVAKIVQAAGGDLQGKRIALLGLTFKPNTDDVRDSVAILIAEELSQMGAMVRAYDPQGMEQARSILGNAIEYCRSADDALDDADLCVIATEWNEFRDKKPSDYKQLMAEPVMVDLRNVFSLDEMAEHGFSLCLGRQVGGRAQARAVVRWRISATQALAAIAVSRVPERRNAMPLNGVDEGKPYDAVIVGSGAGGSSLAYRLAKSGQRVLVVERGSAVPQADPAKPVGHYLYRLLKNPGDPVAFVGGARPSSTVPRSTGCAKAVHPRGEA